MKKVMKITFEQTIHGQKYGTIIELSQEMIDTAQDEAIKDKLWAGYLDLRDYVPPEIVDVKKGKRNYMNKYVPHPFYEGKGSKKDE
jgi:hypothetical protein